MTNAAKSKPKEIEIALDVLSASSVKARDDYDEIRKLLPQLAVHLKRAKRRVTKSILQSAALKGAAHLTQQIQEAIAQNNAAASGKNAVAKTQKRPPREYNDIVKKLPPPDPGSLESQFQKAAKEGDLERVKNLIEEFADVPLVTWAPFLLAIQNDHIEIVRFLLQRDPSLLERGGNRAMDEACALGRGDIVDYFMALDHDFNLQTAWIWALRENHKEIFEKTYNASESVFDDCADELLSSSILGADLDMLKYLFKKEPRLSESLNSDHYWYAATRGDLPMMRYIKRVAKTKPIASEDNIVTMLLHLHKYNQPDILPVLMRQIKIKAQKNLLPWAFILCCYSNNIEMARKIIELHPNCLDNHASLALDIARIHQSFDVLSFLQDDLGLVDSDSLVMISKLDEGMFEWIQVEYEDFEPDLEEVWNKNPDMGKWYKYWEKYDVPQRRENLRAAYFKPVVYKQVLDILKQEHDIKSGDTDLHNADVMILEQYAYQASSLFGSKERVLEYLERWGEANELPLSTLIYTIEIPNTGRPDLKAWGDAVLRCGPKMEKLLKFADKIKRPLQNKTGRHWSFPETRDLGALHAYKKAKESPELARLCFSYGWSEKHFNKALKTEAEYKERYGRTDFPKSKASIPNFRIDGKTFDKPGYQFKKLKDGDPRGLVLGEAVDCCQHLASNGAPCAKHGYLSENAGFYVVEKKETGQIVGQTWAWRGRNGEMVFDSLEYLKDHFDRVKWTKLCDEVAVRLKRRTDISSLRVGTAGMTLRLAFANTARQDLAVPIAFRDYRDSRKGQYLVFER